MHKSKLVELIRKMDGEEQALAADLSEEERSARGEADDWSPKDALAHMAAWTEREADNLAALARGEPAKKYDDYDRVNAEDFEAFRDKPWPEVLEKSAQANRQLIEQIENRSEADLKGPRDEKRTVWQAAAGTACEHPLMHLGQIYRQRGKPQRAAELMEKTSADLLGLDGGRDWEGTVRYNLACHYALAGEKDKAVRGLRQALELNPGLKDWSKEDPDFAAIREDPDYLALYAE
jgi:tetratricopeptide (TPR) repeat protein